MSLDHVLLNQEKGAVYGPFILIQKSAEQLILSFPFTWVVLTLLDWE